MIVLDRGGKAHVISRAPVRGAIDRLRERRRRGAYRDHKAKDSDTIRLGYANALLTDEELSSYRAGAFTCDDPFEQHLEALDAETDNAEPVT
ncbi:MAG: hypothetical protein EA426_13950 [Spirochaetaceae bacterium]|nr:MAG: hypothetical protein EA426_13950 [Spirochaetaceae bacterium]